MTVEQRNAVKFLVYGLTLTVDFVVVFLIKWWYYSFERHRLIESHLK